TYQRCKEQLELGVNEMKNFVRMIYQPFTAEQISKKIAEIVRPEGCQAELEIIFQKIEDLHSACPNHRGDWYFTGNYPTPGGNRVVSKAFINYVEGVNARAY
ncbi:MAG TPA: amidophosphoribosyltransferase, partial [Bacteroidia bacterium]|nr:amidophosphoribosyltransferase [Bacteroidia bacterium]